jgi:KaiC/GvpD/RAD55 family RecA-like ATPase
MSLSVSVYGEPGTGKSVVAASIAVQTMDLGLPCVIISLGRPGSARQLLNQMLALGMPPFARILRRQLTVCELSSPTSARLTDIVQSHLSRDASILVEDIHQVTDVKTETVEKQVHDLARSAGATSIVVGMRNKGRAKSLADVRIDLTRGAVEVERGMWDALMTIKTASGRTAFLVKVGDKSLEFDKRMLP